MKAISPWALRVNSANKYYDVWKNLFQCELLERYYEGFQYELYNSRYRPYTLNMVFSTIENKLANILYQRPRYIVEPQPQYEDWNQEFAMLGAQIKQDALNTIIANPRINFAETIKLAALDSFFRFGIIKVGYAVDWLNPNKTPYVDNSEGKTENKKEADLEVPASESLYFQHIRASRFRVSVTDSPLLDNCAWCGYYEFRYRSDLRKIKGFNLPDNLKASYFANDFNELSAHLEVNKGSPEMFSLLGTGELLKVWHIYDNFNKDYLVFVDNHFDEPCFKTFFERLPFPNVRWHLRAPSQENDTSLGWYPIPPVWNWLSPQDEINQAREQLRNYRRRFTRKFGYLKAGVDTEELEKFTNEIDGEFIEFKRPDAIFPIKNPDIGLALNNSLAVSSEDINLITGTPAPARAQRDRQTATATREAALHDTIRQSVEQMNFANFMVAVGREALLTMKERFTEGLWIKSSIDPGEDFLGEIQTKGPVFKWVTAKDIDDGYDEEIAIDIVNASPSQMEEEETKFMKFLTIVNSFPQMALSPRLIREAARRTGYRNERIIKEMQQAALLHMMGQMAMMQQQTGGGGGSPLGSQEMNANNQSRQIMNAEANTVDEISAQLAGQLGGM